jgi:hypothetical protein
MASSASDLKKNNARWSPSKASAMVMATWTAASPTGGVVANSLEDGGEDPPRHTPESGVPVLVPGRQQLRRCTFLLGAHQCGPKKHRTRTWLLIGVIMGPTVEML